MTDRLDGRPCEAVLAGRCGATNGGPCFALQAYIRARCTDPSTNSVAHALRGIDYAQLVRTIHHTAGHAVCHRAMWPPGDGAPLRAILHAHDTACAGTQHRRVTTNALRGAQPQPVMLRTAHAVLVQQRQPVPRPTKDYGSPGMAVATGQLGSNMERFADHQPAPTGTMRL